MKNMSSQSSNDDSEAVGPVPIDVAIDDRDLRIEIFTLCDGAVDQAGRISLLGTYEVVNTPTFPCVIPIMTVVVRLRFWPGESTKHSLRLTLTSPDGQTIGNALETEFLLHPMDAERSSAYNLVLQLKDTSFHEPGEYTVDFYLGDRLEGRLPFCVRPLEAFA